MINRILIRIKVVQMLYSYLLTRTDFKLMEAPAPAAGPDRQFAYTVYVDLLLLLLELGGRAGLRAQKHPQLQVDKKLATSKVPSALAQDSTVRKFIADDGAVTAKNRETLNELYDKIIASEAYRDFKRHRSATLAQEVAMWQAVFQTIVLRDKGYLANLRQMPDFTTVGLNQGMQMFIETLDSYKDSTEGYRTALADLERSLDKAYQLYLSFFGLIVELTKEEAQRIENGKAKFLATADDLNPNMRLVENRFSARLAEDERIQKAIEKSPINWETEVSLINKLLQSIKDSELYKDYMSSPQSDYAADCEFWREALRTIVFPSDELLESLENNSVFWNDDLQIMGTFVLKTIRQSTINPDEPIKVLTKYKDEEDAHFGAELFEATVKNQVEYRQYIDKFINSDTWDPERIAFMDIVTLEAAIAELVNFPNIPLAVTLNEYINIASAYSTAKSGQFINGILYNVVNMLKENGTIVK